METLEDEALLVDAAQHDRAAFGALYDRHIDAVYHYVASRVGDTAVAEDLTAAVFERALRAIERYEIRGVPFRAWLYRIAGNLVANYRRHNKLLAFVRLPQHLAGGDARGSLDERTAVRIAIGKLSEADQQVVGLYYFAGLAPSQMATVLGCSPDAVHKRLQRARDRLAAELGKADGEHSG